jgi:hypothetical protein
MIIDGLYGIEVSILDWMQVMSHDNVGSQFFVLAYCSILMGYYYH